MSYLIWGKIFYFQCKIGRYFKIGLEQEGNIYKQISDIHKFDKINHIPRKKFELKSIQNRKIASDSIFDSSFHRDALMCVCACVTGLDFEKLNSAITWLLNVISVTMISIKNSSVVTKHSTVARHTTRTHWKTSSLEAILARREMKLRTETNSGWK